MTEQHPITCSDCQTSLTEPVDLPIEQRRPCPTCGSMRRTRNVTAGNAVPVGMKSMLRAKHLRPGKRKPVTELVTGDAFFHGTGRWMKKERRIDRANDRYVERVTDPVTGRIVHECDEPLSEHRGHGSVKPKAEPPDVP